MKTGGKCEIGLWNSCFEGKSALLSSYPSDYFTAFNEVWCCASVNLYFMKDSRNALHWSASGGSTLCVQYCVDFGLDPSLPDDDGWTALHLAV